VQPGLVQRGNGRAPDPAPLREPGDERRLQAGARAGRGSRLQAADGWAGLDLSQARSEQAVAQRRGLALAERAEGRVGIEGGVAGMRLRAAGHEDDPRRSPLTHTPHPNYGAIRIPPLATAKGWSD